MRKLLIATTLLALVAMAGCAITNYPIIYDARGDYSGIVRTGHRAYIVPSGGIATLWNDGSDELLTLVFQNQYGDKKLYTKNNYDPTQSVIFNDDTYCDWRWETCVIVEAWDPVVYDVDVFDYWAFPDCEPGYRSLSLLVSYGFRIQECGDRFDKQELAAVFADLSTTTWRGETAYVLPVNSANTQVTLTVGETTVDMPIYGHFTNFLTGTNDIAVPMTPNARNELRWLLNFTAEYGNTVNMTLTYNSLSTEIPLRVRPEGLLNNLDRF